MFDDFSILLVFVVWVSQQTQPGSCRNQSFLPGPKFWLRNGGRWRRRRPETKTSQDFVGLTRESSKESVGVCWRRQGLTLASRSVFSLFVEDKNSDLHPRFIRWVSRHASAQSPEHPLKKPGSERSFWKLWEVL